MDIQTVRGNLSDDGNHAYFTCVQCHKKQKTIGVSQKIAAVCCAVIHVVEINRRRDASSRSRDGRSRVRIVQWNSKHPLKLADYCKGGIGVKVHLLDRGISLQLGQRVTVHYVLLGEQLISHFIVRSICPGRIGLAYADGLCLSPGQRLIADIAKNN